MPGADTLRSFAAPLIVPATITARITSICLKVSIPHGSQFAPRRSRATSGHPVDKISYRTVRDARVIRQADLTGPVGGIAALAAGRDRIGQTAERMVVQFGRREALVAGEAAASDTFRHDDRFG